MVTTSILYTAISERRAQNAIGTRPDPMIQRLAKVAAALRDDSTYNSQWTSLNERPLEPLLHYWVSKIT